MHTNTTFTQQKIVLYISLFSKFNTGSGLGHNHNSGFCSSKSIRTEVESYLFYNLYIFDLFGPPLQLRLPQCVQIVQIQTHETWTRLKEEHFKWYKEPLWILFHLSIFVLIIGNHYGGIGLHACNYRGASRPSKCFFYPDGR